MSRDFDIQVKGLRELQSQIMELGAAVGVKVLAKDARKALKPVQARAQQLVSYDTGLTKNNIKISVKKPKHGNAVVVAGLQITKVKGVAARKRTGGKATSPDWRWHFLEFGTAHSAAKPFLRPAFESNTEKMVYFLKAEINKDIKRIISKRFKLKKAARKAAQDALLKSMGVGE